MCNRGQLGDEFHFCLECPALKELKNKFLPANIKITLVNVAKFIKFGPDMCTH